MAKCKNFKWLRNFVFNWDLVQTILSGDGRHNLWKRSSSKDAAHRKAKRLVNAVLLTCTPLLLHYGQFGFFQCTRFPEAQAVVYNTDKIFFGDDHCTINTVWALNCVEFFRDHLLNTHRATLVAHYEDLDIRATPQMWRQRLHIPAKDEFELGHVWKGSYSYLDRNETNLIRQTNSTRKYQFIDKNVNNDHPIQTMRIWRSVPGKENIPNMSFETYIQAFQAYAPFVDYETVKQVYARTKQNVTREWYDKVQASRAAVRDNTVPFEGIGYDDENFYVTGWINRLPAHEGIPGWSRVTMVKYFMDAQRNVDLGALWAYEGVIFPGSQMMVGRWWQPGPNVTRQNAYSGPFILWNVDSSWNPEDLEVSYPQSACFQSFLMLPQSKTNFNGLKPGAWPQPRTPAAGLQLMDPEEFEW